MKNSDKRVTVKFTGAEKYADGENAPAGMCERLVNLREKRDAMVAVGHCLPVGELTDGERIAAVHYVAGGRNLISVIGNRLYWHGVIGADGEISMKGVVITSAGIEITSVVPVGEFLVCATANEPVIVKYDMASAGYAVPDTTGAVPRLLLSPSGKYAMNDTVAAYEFDTPLTHWQRPLPTGDVEHISANAADAYRRLASRAATEGYMV